MSYILDALKKSDQERKRGDVPNLQTVHIPMNTEPQTPVFLYGFIFLLLIALAFVIGFVVSDQGNDGIQTVDTNNHSQNKYAINKGVTAASLQKVEKTASPIVKKKVIAPPNVTVLQQSSEKVIQNDSQINLKSVKAEIVNEEILAKEQLKPDLNDIPYLHEMPDYRQQSVPDMNFAGHVYSGTPSSRSVIINGSVMSEGDVIVQGLNVIEITPGGVVFSLHNELFRMDILQDWSFE